MEFRQSRHHACRPVAHRPREPGRLLPAPSAADPSRTALPTLIVVPFSRCHGTVRLQDSYRQQRGRVSWRQAAKQTTINPMATRDSDDRIAELYQGPLDEFTAARNALAKETGDSAIKKLEKPNLAAWAVNQLYWQRAEALRRGDQDLRPGAHRLQADAGRQVRRRARRRGVSQRGDAQGQGRDPRACSRRPATVRPTR